MQNNGSQGFLRKFQTVGANNYSPLLNIRNRIYLKQFLKALPLTISGIICWTIGEAIGYADISLKKQ